MLVLSRRLNQAIVIAGEVRVTVLAITPSRVELGVEAPRQITVDREEIHLRRQQCRIPAAADDSGESAAEEVTTMRIFLIATLLVAAGTASAAEPEKWPLVIPAPHGSVILPNEKPSARTTSFAMPRFAASTTCCTSPASSSAGAKMRGETRQRSSCRSTAGCSA